MGWIFQSWQLSIFWIYNDRFIGVFNACLDNCWLLSVCYLLQCGHQHGITSVKVADLPAVVLCIVNPLSRVNLEFNVMNIRIGHLCLAAAGARTQRGLYIRRTVPCAGGNCCGFRRKHPKIPVRKLLCNHNEWNSDETNTAKIRHVDLCNFWNMC